MTAKLVFLFVSLSISAFAQSSAFTYQGRLNHAGAPANDLYEITFALYDSATAGYIVGTPITVAPVPVTNGLFTATLDFGPAAFTGAPRWLEFSVTVYGTDQPVVTLTPRQPITPTPYASLAGGLTAIGTNINTLPAFRIQAAPESPNIIAGYFQNTVSNGVSGAVVSGGGAVIAANIAGGNFATVSGGYGNRALGHAATVAGGQRNTAAAVYDTVSGGEDNAADGMWSTIAGGGRNHANGTGSSIGGGFANETLTSGAVIGGGTGNIGAGQDSAIPGGRSNVTYGAYSFVGGYRAKNIGDGSFVWADHTEEDFESRQANQFLIRARTGVGINTNDPAGAALNVAGTVRANMFEGAGGPFMFNSLDGQPLEFKVGGERVLRLEFSTESPNVIGGSSANYAAPAVVGAFIGGGGTLDDGVGYAYTNSVTGDYGTVAGGFGNSASGGSFIGGGSLNRTDTAGASTIGGGLLNRIHFRADAATIGGGDENTIQSESINATISGGANNRIGSEADASTIGGGAENTIEGIFATIDGGYQNSSSSHFATIGGGESNTIHSYAFHGTIAGGAQNTISEFDGSGLFGSIGGGLGNRVNGNAATVAGGEANQSVAEHGAIGGGKFNYIGDVAGAIAGGENNSVFAAHGFVGGGMKNSSIGSASVVAGGSRNTSTGLFATIGGGERNSADGVGTTIGGGYQNSAQGDYGTVMGGYQNSAGGTYSVAAGRRALTEHSGAFVFADSNDADFISSTNNEFSVRSTGGVRLVTAVESNGAPTAGVSLAPGSGTWASLSDRNAKENFTPTQSREVLDKVATLPIATWNYKSQDESIRHIGPTAQDFHAAFGVGENNRTITTVDADGIALAAIHGLNQKLEQELKTKDAQIRQLESDLADLKQAVRTLMTK